MTSRLKKAYDPEKFKVEGHQLIDTLSDYISSALQNKSQKVTDWNLPDNEYAFWKNYLSAGKSNTLLFEEVLKHSIHTHNPRYMGHQIAPTVPISALATLQSALMNNGMAVYEMGMASTAMERIVIDTFNEALGYDVNAGGLLTSGGTLANLTALLCARNVMASNDVWNDGLDENLAVMVSEEAHYCVSRAAKIMGFGEGGIIKVPVNENFTIDTTKLDTCLAEATAKGLKVIALVGSAPSTSTGMYDDLETLGDFCTQHQLWFHVDAAHGGAAIFSPQYKSLLKGINRADSVVIDGHKMMMTSSITTALLFKDHKDSYKTFSQKAQYLWGSQEDEDWFNMAKRTFECTKSMMSLRFFAILNEHGTALFDDFVTTLYDSGKQFATMVKAHEDFELLLVPDSNIVCFRYSKASAEKIDLCNRQIRQQLLEDGEFYIVETQIKGRHYLRVTIMNPFTERSHFERLLDKISEIGKNIETKDHATL